MTGSATTLIFLIENGCDIKYDMVEFEELVCKVDQSKMSKEEVSKFLGSISESLISQNINYFFRSFIHKLTNVILIRLRRTLCK